jgi:DNA polymerase-3 subunit gamma/tau
MRISANIGGYFLTYQVIARKWRPKNFTELIGQNHVSKTLLNAIRGDRIPHAILLTGPRGTGKTSTARILAKSLRCPNAKNFVPCDTCSDCTDISDSRNINVIEIDGASNNGVDSIRELRDTVFFMPSSGKFKIYIIDEVHMLSSSAFNALLKTLEEPPAHVLFIMATTEAQKIPITVLSRCQRFDFRKISTKLIAEQLQEICKKEKFNASTEAVWALARQSDGSMRDSQSLLDQVVSFCNGELTLENVTEVLGLTDRKLLSKTIEGLISRNTKTVMEVIESIFEAGYDPIVFMKDLLEELRNLVITKVTAQQAENIVDLPKDEVAILIELSKSLSEEDIHLLFDMALKGAHDLYRAQDTRVVLEMILLRMSIAPRISNLLNINLATSSQATTKTDNHQSTYASTSASTHTPTSAPETAAARKAPTRVAVTADNDMPTAKSAPAAGNKNDHLWNDFVERLRKVNGLMAAKLDQLHLLDVQNKVATVGVPEKYKFLFAEASSPDFQKKLANYLNTFWGPGHTVTVKMVGQDIATSITPSKLLEKNLEQEKATINQKVEDHPLVRQAKSIFNNQTKTIREN